MSIVLRLQERPTVNPVRAHRFSRLGKTGSRVRLAAGVLGSLALFPLVVVQGTATRRRMPSLPAAKPPHRGFFPGAGPSLRILAIGDSSVSGVGVARGDETVSATTARALARLTGRPVAWRAVGLSGATVSKAMDELVPRLVSEPADLLIVAFGVNDAVAYRSPSAFANDLAALVIAARGCVGNAAVVIAGVAPLAFFPGLPWPLRTILGWRCAALQASAERLSGLLARLVVERFSEMLVPELFASDGFHPNGRAHALWGEEIAALALPLLADGAKPVALAVRDRTLVCRTALVRDRRRLLRRILGTSETVARDRRNIY
jgi:lysophospholipase L1-like esterase